MPPSANKSSPTSTLGNLFTLTTDFADYTDLAAHVTRMNLCHLRNLWSVDTVETFSVVHVEDLVVKRRMLQYLVQVVTVGVGNENLSEAVA